MKCIYCGEEIKKKHKSGKERRICYKVECEKKYRAEMMRNYYHKKKQGLPISKRGQHKTKKEETKTTYVHVGKGKKQIVCDICGSVAIVPAGRKLAYCDNPSCESIAKKRFETETQKKWDKVIEREAEQEEQQEEKINQDYIRTYRDNDVIYVKNLIPAADKLAMDVIDFAKRLGTLKYEADQLKLKLSKLQSEKDLEDSQFLHAIEAAQSMTAGEAIRLVKEAALKRAQRRDTKTLYGIVSFLSNGIPINPLEYAQRQIKGAAKTNVTYAMKHEEDKKTDQGVK